MDCQRVNAAGVSQHHLEPCNFTFPSYDQYKKSTSYPGEPRIRERSGRKFTATVMGLDVEED
jgi:hypothetical protein